MEAIWIMTLFLLFSCLWGSPCQALLLGPRTGSLSSSHTSRYLQRDHHSDSEQTADTNSEVKKPSRGREHKHAQAIKMCDRAKKITKGFAHSAGRIADILFINDDDIDIIIRGHISDTDKRHQ